MALAAGLARSRVVLALGAVALAGVLACGTLLGIQPDSEPPGADAALGEAAADGMVQGDVAVPDGGGSADADAAMDAGFRVFVTHGTWPGDLGGGAAVSVARGDAQCQAAADAVGLAGTFRAWLSDGDAGAGSRLPSANGVPYRRLDGVVVVKTFSDFTRTGSSVLEQPIDHDENGGPLAAVTVWTGTAAGGTVAPITCLDWTSDSGIVTGMFGNSSLTSDSWTAAGPFSCSGPAHLYCMQTTH